MGDQTFTLNDGREVTIHYSPNQGFGRYTVLIDGEVQEKDVSCGRSWSHKTIEATVRKRYDTLDAPAPEKLTVDPENCIAPKKDNGRAVDFRLELLIGRANIKMMHKPTDLDKFLSAAEELGTLMDQIADLTRTTKNPELKQKAAKIRTRYEKSDYYNY